MDTVVSIGLLTTQLISSAFVRASSSASEEEQLSYFINRSSSN